jgi:nucleoid-associated protein YgaU
MLEVTCFHCGQVVQISPDAERCSVCGMNLRKLIGREQASGYFYQRAADMAGNSNVLGALQEVQRGLAYINTSELNLLGAILCKRLGRWEDMRHFVAAIPADDSLRGEGEWLLRSNQARQRPPAPTQRGKAPVAIPVIPDSDALPVVMDEVAPSAARRGAEPARRGLAPVAWLVVAALLLGGGWLAWQGDLLGSLELPGAQVAGPPAIQPAAVDGQAVPQEGAAPAMGAESGASPKDSAAPAGGAAADGAVVPGTTTDGTTAPEPTAPGGGQETAPSLLLPTPTIAPNLARTDPTAQAIASASDDLAVSASNLTDLNWKAWLEGQNRADLAALPVTVRMDSRTLILEGTVEFAEQRAALEFQANQVRGVNDISVVNVVVRPPATYTVREGDSLWAISVRIYGNADLVEELYAANRNQLTSAGDLRVGMVLTVPPLE